MNPVRSSEVTGSQGSRRQGPTTLFTIPLKSSMTDADLARLRTELDLVTYSSPKPGVSGAEPGVVPLDFWSGLFLEPGDGDGEWLLEARTWSNPPDSLVHEWQVRAAIAAQSLDPGVTIPPRTDTAGTPSEIRPLGRAETKHLTRFGHRLLRLG